MDIYNVKLTLTQQLLGTLSKSPVVFQEHMVDDEVVTAGMLSEELATLPAPAEPADTRGYTGFHTEDGKPLLYDYVLKGFFKDACGMLRRVPERLSAGRGIRAYKKVIDGLVFVAPRKIFLQLPEGATLGLLERPLRAPTPQGPRVALLKSDTAPPGTVVAFILTILGQVPEPLLREWLDYGRLRGLGQWRNAGWGTFTYEMEKVEQPN